MNENSKIEIAKIILTKTGILENRALIVQEIEEELETIYSELDNSKQPSKSITPTRYYQEVQTEFDLISNNEIHRLLYKAQTKEQRLFLRKITHHEDFYFSVNRGSGHNFKQEWHFNFRLRKEDFNLDHDETFSFTLIVGIRDIFPYDVEIDSFNNIISNKDILKFFLH